MTAAPDSSSAPLVLMTGFDVFYGTQSNPTQDLMLRLQDMKRPNLTTLVLPTAYRRGADELLRVLQLMQPRWLVMTGLNASAAHLRYEQVALNFDHSSKPDNDGEVRQRRHIAEGGPVGFWNELPFDELSTAAAEAGEELELSRDAGGFVCNHVYFAAREFLSQQAWSASAGFVHVPPLGPERLERVAGVFAQFAARLQQRIEQQDQAREFTDNR